MPFNTFPQSEEEQNAPLFENYADPGQVYDSIQARRQNGEEVDVDAEIGNHYANYYKPLIDEAKASGDKKRQLGLELAFDEDAGIISNGYDEWYSPRDARQTEYKIDLDNTQRQMTGMLSQAMDIDAQNPTLRGKALVEQAEDGPHLTKDGADAAEKTFKNTKFWTDVVGFSKEQAERLAKVDVYSDMSVEDARIALAAIYALQNAGDTMAKAESSEQNLYDDTVRAELIRNGLAQARVNKAYRTADRELAPQMEKSFAELGDQIASKGFFEGLGRSAEELFNLVDWTESESDMHIRHQKEDRSQQLAVAKSLTFREDGALVIPGSALDEDKDYVIMDAEMAQSWMNNLGMDAEAMREYVYSKLTRSFMPSLKNIGGIGSIYDVTEIVDGKPVQRFYLNERLFEQENYKHLFNAADWANCVSYMKDNGYAEEEINKLTEQRHAAQRHIASIRDAAMRDNHLAWGYADTVERVKRENPELDDTDAIIKALEEYELGWVAATVGNVEEWGGTIVDMAGSIVQGGGYLVNFSIEGASNLASAAFDAAGANEAAQFITKWANTGTQFVKEYGAIGVGQAISEVGKKMEQPYSDVAAYQTTAGKYVGMFAKTALDLAGAGGAGKAVGSLMSRAVGRVAAGTATGLERSMVENVLKGAAKAGAERTAALYGLKEAEAASMAQFGAMLGRKGTESLAGASPLTAAIEAMGSKAVLRGAERTLAKRGFKRGSLAYWIGIESGPATSDFFNDFYERNLAEALDARGISREEFDKMSVVDKAQITELCKGFAFTKTLVFAATSSLMAYGANFVLSEFGEKLLGMGSIERQQIRRMTANQASRAYAKEAAGRLNIGSSLGDVWDIFRETNLTNKGKAQMIALTIGHTALNTTKAFAVEGVTEFVDQISQGILKNFGKYGKDFLNKTDWVSFWNDCFEALTAGGFMGAAMHNANIPQWRRENAVLVAKKEKIYDKLVDAFRLACEPRARKLQAEIEDNNLPEWKRAQAKFKLSKLRELAPSNYNDAAFAMIFDADDTDTKAQLDSATRELRKYGIWRMRNVNEQYDAYRAEAVQDYRARLVKALEKGGDDAAANLHVFDAMEVAAQLTDEQLKEIGMTSAFDTDNAPFNVSEQGGRPIMEKYYGVNDKNSPHNRLLALEAEQRAKKDWTPEKEAELQMRKLQSKAAINWVAYLDILKKRSAKTKEETVKKKQEAVDKTAAETEKASKEAEEAATAVEELKAILEGEKTEGAAKIADKQEKDKAKIADAEDKVSKANDKLKEAFEKQEEADAEYNKAVLAKGLHEDVLDSITEAETKLKKANENLANAREDYDNAVKDLEALRKEVAASAKSAVTEAKKRQHKRQEEYTKAVAKKRKADMVLAALNRQLAARQQELANAQQGNGRFTVVEAQDASDATRVLSFVKDLSVGSTFTSSGLAADIDAYLNGVKNRLESDVDVANAISVDKALKDLVKQGVLSYTNHDVNGQTTKLYRVEKDLRNVINPSPFSTTDLPTGVYYEETGSQQTRSNNIGTPNALAGASFKQFVDIKDVKKKKDADAPVEEKAVDDEIPVRYNKNGEVEETHKPKLRKYAEMLLDDESKKLLNPRRVAEAKALGLIDNDDGTPKLKFGDDFVKELEKRYGANDVLVTNVRKLLDILKATGRDGNLVIRAVCDVAEGAPSALYDPVSMPGTQLISINLACPYDLAAGVRADITHELCHGAVTALLRSNDTPEFRSALFEVAHNLRAVFIANLGAIAKRIAMDTWMMDDAGRETVYNAFINTCYALGLETADPKSTYRMEDDTLVVDWNAVKFKDNWDAQEFYSVCSSNPAMGYLLSINGEVAVETEEDFKDLAEGETFLQYMMNKAYRAYKDRKDEERKLAFDERAITAFLSSLVNKDDTVPPVVAEANSVIKNAIEEAGKTNNPLRAARVLASQSGYIDRKGETRANRIQGEERAANVESARRNLIGVNAATWKNYPKDRIFKVPFDDKLRIEIDSSQARVKKGSKKIVNQAASFTKEDFVARLANLPRDIVHNGVMLNKLATPEQREAERKKKQDAINFLNELGLPEDVLLDRAIAISSKLDEIDDYEDEDFRAAVADELTVSFVEETMGDSGLMRYYQMSEEDRENLREAVVSAIGGKPSEANPAKLNKLLDKYGFDFGERSYRMEDVLEYEELFAAYPEFADRRIFWEDFPADKEGVAGYANGHDIHLNKNLMTWGDKQMLNTLIHELQHLIQYKENFPRGASQDEAMEDALRSLYDNPAWFIFDNYEEDFVKKMKDSLARSMYSSYAGEQEAMKVEERRLFDEQKRKATPFYNEYDNKLSRSAIVRYNFIGENAKNWQELVQNGAQVFTGADGKKRIEIDDGGVKFKIPLARLKREKYGEEMMLQDVIDFPQLFEAYPSFKTITFVLENLPFEQRVGHYAGWYEPSSSTIKLDPRTTVDEAVRTIIHELQHAIQEKEGFAIGGNPETSYADTKEFLHRMLGRSDDKRTALHRYKNWLASMLHEWGREEEMQMTDAKQVVNTLLKNKIEREREKRGVTDKTEGLTKREASKLKRFNARVERQKREKLAEVFQTRFGQFFYRALAGEQESRIVEERHAMSPEERAASHPSQDTWFEYHAPVFDTEKNLVAFFKNMEKAGFELDKSLPPLFHWGESGVEGVRRVLYQMTNGTLRFGNEQIIRPKSEARTDEQGNVRANVIGPHAVTWDKYKDKAFKGRDDGMERAEIDSNKAKLAGFAASSAADVAKNIIDSQAKTKEEVMSAIEKSFSTDRLDEAIDFFYEEIASLVETRDERGLAELLEALWNESLSTGGKHALKLKLGDVLEFDELYEAYPSLKDMSLFVTSRDGQKINGAYSADDNAIIIIDDVDGDYAKSVLLHEVQHAIQFIEGFEQGGTPESAANIVNAIAEEKLVAKYPKRFNEYKKLKERGEWLHRQIAGLREWNDGTPEQLQRIENYTDELKGLSKTIIATEVLGDDEFSSLIKDYYTNATTAGYLRLAGEIESRNVQSRMNMTAEEREATPFNETLEYPGEAIVIRANSFTPAPDHYVHKMEPSYNVLSNEEKNQALQDNGGAIVAGNGVLVDMRDEQVRENTFARHASPTAGIRKFLTERAGGGMDSMYGVGLYFSTRDEVHRGYKKRIAEEARVNPSEYEVELNIDGPDDPSMLRHWRLVSDDDLLEKANALLKEKGFPYEVQSWNTTNGQLYSALTQVIGSRSASRWLRENGKKGFVVEDEYSEPNQESATYNYVIFDESDVQIIRYNDAEGKYKDEVKKRMAVEYPDGIRANRIDYSDTTPGVIPDFMREERDKAEQAMKEAKRMFPYPERIQHGYYDELFQAIFAGAWKNDKGATIPSISNQDVFDYMNDPRFYAATFRPDNVSHEFVYTMFSMLNDMATALDGAQVPTELMTVFAQGVKTKEDMEEIVQLIQDFVRDTAHLGFDGGATFLGGLRAIAAQLAHKGPDLFMPIGELRAPGVFFALQEYMLNKAKMGEFSLYKKATGKTIKLSLKERRERGLASKNWLRDTMSRFWLFRLLMRPFHYRGRKSGYEFEDANKEQDQQFDHWNNHIVSVSVEVGKSVKSFVDAGKTPEERDKRLALVRDVVGTTDVYVSKEDYDRIMKEKEDADNAALYNKNAAIRSVDLWRDDRLSAISPVIKDARQYLSELKKNKMEKSTEFEQATKLLEKIEAYKVSIETRHSLDVSALDKNYLDSCNMNNLHAGELIQAIRDKSMEEYRAKQAEARVEIEKLRDGKALLSSVDKFRTEVDKLSAIAATTNPEMANFFKANQGLYLRRGYLEYLDKDGHYLEDILNSQDPKKVALVEAATRRAMKDIASDVVDKYSYKWENMVAKAKAMKAFTDNAKPDVLAKVAKVREEVKNLVKDNVTIEGVFGREVDSEARAAAMIGVLEGTSERERWFNALLFDALVSSASTTVSPEQAKDIQALLEEQNAESMNETEAGWAEIRDRIAKNLASEIKNLGSEEYKSLLSLRQREQAEMRNAAIRKLLKDVYKLDESYMTEIGEDGNPKDISPRRFIPNVINDYKSGKKFSADMEALIKKALHNGEVTFIDPFVDSPKNNTRETKEEMVDSFAAFVIYEDLLGDARNRGLVHGLNKEKVRRSVETLLSQPDAQSLLRGYIQNSFMHESQTVNSFRWDVQKEYRDVLGQVDTHSMEGLIRTLADTMTSLRARGLKNEYLKGMLEIAAETVPPTASGEMPVLYSPPPTVKTVDGSTPKKYVNLGELVKNGKLPQTCLYQAQNVWVWEDVAEDIKNALDDQFFNFEKVGVGQKIMSSAFAKPTKLILTTDITAAIRNFYGAFAAVLENGILHPIRLAKAFKYLNKVGMWNIFTGDGEIMSYLRKHGMVDSALVDFMGDIDSRKLLEKMLDTDAKSFWKNLPYIGKALKGLGFGLDVLEAIYKMPDVFGKICAFSINMEEVASFKSFKEPVAEAMRKAEADGKPLSGVTDPRLEDYMDKQAFDSLIKAVYEKVATEQPTGFVLHDLFRKEGLRTHENDSEGLKKFKAFLNGAAKVRAPYMMFWYCMQRYVLVNPQIAWSDIVSGMKNGDFNQTRAGVLRMLSTVGTMTLFSSAIKAFWTAAYLAVLGSNDDDDDDKWRVVDDEKEIEELRECGAFPPYYDIQKVLIMTNGKGADMRVVVANIDYTDPGSPYNTIIKHATAYLQDMGNSDKRNNFLLSMIGPWRDWVPMANRLLNSEEELGERNAYAQYGGENTFGNFFRKAAGSWVADDVNFFGGPKMDRDLTWLANLPGAYKLGVVARPFKLGKAIMYEDERPGGTRSSAAQMVGLGAVSISNYSDKIVYGLARKKNALSADSDMRNAKREYKKGNASESQLELKSGKDEMFARECYAGYKRLVKTAGMSPAEAYSVIEKRVAPPKEVRGMVKALIEEGR